MSQKNVLRREAPQLVEVTLRDGTSHHIAPQVLDVLIESDHILKFRRANGWATVGADPVRAKRRSDLCILYYGPERRVHY